MKNVRWEQANGCLGKTNLLSFLFLGLSHSLVATKYVQDGMISVWNLEEAIKMGDGNPYISVETITQLRWYEYKTA